MIRQFGGELNDGAVGLFYYAGHGLQVQGTNFLVPVTADPLTVADVDFELIDANIVLKQMEAAGSKLNIVILDACRNNPFGGRGLRDASAGLAPMRAPRGTLISYATQPGNTALDGNTGHSPYTTALAAEIKRPGLQVFEMFNEVSRSVDKTTGGRQQPWIATSPLEGAFYFTGPVTTGGAAGPATSISGPAPVPPGTADSEIIFWLSIAGTDKAADFEEYLRQYPEGRFAGLARNRLAVLAHPKTAPAESNVATTPLPRSSKCNAESDEQVTRPVRLLYQAVNAKSIQLYADQWSEDGIYRSLSHGTVRNKADKVENRRRAFASWEKVNLSMDRIAVVERAADHAIILVTYSMTVKTYGYPPSSEKGVAGRYKVVCGSEGRWLIRENDDEG